jgi:FkbM family methyltransferase
MVRIATIEHHSFVSDWLGPTSVVVDLGVNTGGFSMDMITRGCTVYGVEPLVELTSTLAPHPRLHVEPVAITGGESEVDLFLNPSRCASLELVERGALSVTVPGCTLERLLDDWQLGKADLLKVDIEGAEIAMFDTTRDEVILRFRQITVEFHDFIDLRLGDDVARVCQRMARLGFDRITFSRYTNGDVLFLNPACGLGRVDRATVLVWDKYVRGAVRHARRRIGSREHRVAAASLKRPSA